MILVPLDFADLLNSVVSVFIVWLLLLLLLLLLFFASSFEDYCMIEYVVSV